MAEKKAAIYIRVSTDAQREEGYSIDAQKEALAAHCVSKGIKNYEFYIDGGFTGSNIDRPEMQRLINDVKAKKVDRVVVYKLDRLSRSQKDTLYLIEDVFNPHGVDFVSMNESMDTSTPLGRLMLGILSAFAQLERENIKERTRMGMKERVKEGYWPGGGRTPFGYDYDNEKGVLVPNKDAETVRQIYKLYIEGYSAHKIAQMLGIKYEGWIRQILMKKSNAGYIVYNDEEYLGKHEPIVPLETYQKAMDFMFERSITRSTDGEYLLTGLLYCGKCGAKMRYQKWGKAAKIVCYSKDKNKPHLVKDANCDSLNSWADEVETAVINDLFEFSNKLGKSDVAPPKESILDFLGKQYDEASKKIKKLYNLYAESDDDLLLETIEESKKKLLDIQKQIDREHERNVMTNKFVSVRSRLKDIEETWPLMGQKERKDVVRSAIEKIVVINDEIEIFYKFRNLAE